ncbi:hypothetical protein TRICI_001589 [Trichomonascus ciferrii]|uniref:Enoyl-CoA hydratase n=1 Tax=Trichomonascus ciferrii TaxID=44093 RepID=A0A642V9S1_9ASCO|nr:hypothetical protein TRICI_001589 [Trichomonascus ciferrii]
MSDYSKFDLYSVSKPADFVLHVQFNRPKQLNAVNPDSYRQFKQIFDIAEFDKDVRVIVLSGQGRAFCAGLDLNAVAGNITSDDDDDEDSSRKAIHQHAFIKEFQECIGRPHTINKPVIAVAHGPSIGLAIDILSSVDIRIASKDAILSIREIAIGMAADIGTLQRLPKVVNNLGWLKEVALTGRNFTPEEAKEQGLINSVAETKDKAVSDAIELAKTIAAHSPVASHGTKKAINYAIDHSVPDSLEQIAEFNAHAVGGDLVKGAMSARAKEKPTYAKL